MGRIFLALIVIALSAGVANSQTTLNDTSRSLKVFTKVEKEAKFPGGLKGWQKYLEANLDASIGGRYIKLKKGEKLAQQTARIEFIVSNSGKVSLVRVSNPSEVHPKIAKEAMRVIKEGPDWEPAEQNNKRVTYQAVQLITFQVSNE